MKTNFNKCWKLIGGGLAASSLLATSVVAPLTSNKYQDQKQNNTSLTKSEPLSVSSKSSGVNASVSDPITSVDASVLFNDASLTGTSISITTTPVTNSVYNVTITSGTIDAPDKDLTMVDSFTEGGDTYNVTAIGDSAFVPNKFSCNSLTFPSSLETIGNFSFERNPNLKKIDLSQCTKLTSIGQSAFSTCSSLSSVDLSGCIKLSSIGNNAFGNCAITSLVTPDQPTTETSDWTWGDDGAGTATFRTRAYWNDGRICGEFVETVDTQYKVVGGLAYGNIDLSNTTITEIATGAFSACTGITNVIFPGTLTTIAGYSFNGTNITQLTLDFSRCNSLKTIGAAAFASRALASFITPGQEPGLSSWTWGNDGSGNDTFRTRVFYDNQGSIVGQTIESVDSEGAAAGSLAYGDIDLSNLALSELPAQAFYGCGSITSVTLPASGLTSIGMQSFSQSTITSLVLPDTITTIGDRAFSTCQQLASINLPNSISGIGQSAFKGCTALTNISFPNSLTTLSNGVCSGCTSLKSVSLPNSISTIENNAFLSSSNVSRIDLTECTDTTVSNWTAGILSSFSSSAEWLIPYTTDDAELGNWATAINSAYGSDPVELGFSRDISNYATGTSLSGNIDVILSDKTLASSPLIITNGKDLQATDLVINDDTNISTIADGAFLDNTNLTGSLTIPATISNIETNAFGGCTGISTVDLSKYSYSSTPTNWADGCFSGCSADFLIPPSIDTRALSVWYSAIRNWTSETNPSTFVNDDAQHWADGVTSGNFELRIDDDTGASTLMDGSSVAATNLSINGNTGVVGIGDYAFANDISLIGSVTIPSVITSIGANVFNGCNNVNMIQLNWTNLSKANALNINHDWLGNLNNSNTTILVPEGMTDAYQAVATTWGMDQCTITDGTTPPSPTPTPTDNNDYLGIALGLGIGMGVSLIGVVVGWIAYAIQANKTKKIS